MVDFLAEASKKISRCKDSKIFLNLCSMKVVIAGDEEIRLCDNGGN